jgi:tetratricopeptide (TPR) repeat protein
MRRFAPALFALICLLLAAHAPVQAKDTWTSVCSKNFFLIGNASEKEIRQVATRLEQFRDVFTRIFAGADFQSPVPTTVVVFKNDGAYKPFKPVVDGKISDVAGYFQPGEDVNYITLTPPRGGEDPFQTIYHEYVHLLLENTLGRSSVPAWFNEGLAEYYSTFDIVDGRKVWLGKLDEGHLLLLRQTKLNPLQTLFSLDHYSLHRNKREAKGLFYAQSWALVHYLILGNEGKRRPQVVKFINAMAANKPVEAAFRESFQTDFAAMEKELRNYVEGHRFRAEVVTFERKLEFDDEMQTATLTEAEAETYLGDLLLHTNRAEEAVKRLEAAVSLDPKHGPAHASLGMAYMRLKRYEDARRHLREAVAANAQNYLAHYYYAYTLSREGTDETGYARGFTDEAARSMRDSLRKAIALKPDFPESYHLLAFVNLVTGQDLEESVKLLSRARELAPGNARYALILAQIYLRQENFDAARATIEPLTRETADPQMRGPARALLGQIDSLREQFARYKAAREEAERRGAVVEEAEDNDEDGRGGAGGAPRLQRRAAPVGDAARGQGPPKSDDERVAEAMNEALNEALRKPLAGETRAEGVLKAIECSAKGLVFVVRVGDRTLRLASTDFESVHIMAFTREAGDTLTCGARKDESRVLITYRPPAGARAKSDGTIAALEFVPATFKLAR